MDKKWKQNKDLFFRLRQSYTHHSTHRFFVVDCELNYLDNDSIRIEKYIAEKLICANYWNEAGEDLYKCQVQYKDPAKQTKHHPRKGSILRLPCHACQGMIYL